MTADPDFPTVPKCQQCGGPCHICEQADSTCRFVQAAGEFLDRVNLTFDKYDRRELAALLRATEDGAWERLSKARTKRIAELEPENGTLRAELTDMTGHYLDAEADARRLRAIIARVSGVVLEAVALDWITEEAATAFVAALGPKP